MFVKPTFERLQKATGDYASTVNILKEDQKARKTSKKTAKLPFSTFNEIKFQEVASQDLTLDLA